MACRVRYLSSAGIHSREIKGVDQLAAAFPANWLFYTSLQCYPHNEVPIEIDAMIVTDDRVLLLELKDWNGNLTHNGDQWLIGGRRARSPVDLVAMKARKVKTFLVANIPGFAKHYVDSRVVLTGTASKAGLSVAEQQSVWSLQEALSIATPAGRSSLLGRVTLQPKKTFDFEADFERLTRNARMFGPLEAEWDGYKVTEEDFVTHPQGVWREHRAERIRDQRYKALLRIWAFDKLPPGLNSPDKRRFVAEREMRAIGHLTELGSKLVQDGGILPSVGNDKDEILTQHFELRALQQGWTTLDRFLIQMQDAPSVEDRLVMVSSLLNLFAELHSQGIYHRDIGARAIWAGTPTRMSMTGLVCCQLPNEQSISDWASTLRGYAEVAPEDMDTKLIGTASQRDVFALGKLASLLLKGSATETTGSPQPLTEISVLDGWISKATSVVPGDRFRDAGEMADAFARVVEKGIVKEIDQSLIDRHETNDNPYVLFPQNGAALQQSARCHVFITSQPADTVVKIWLGIRRGLNTSTDLALMRLFDGVSRLISSPIPGLPRFLRASLSPVGPFVLYRHENAYPISALLSGAEAPPTALPALRLVSSLLHAVDALHGLGISHGDLSDNNVLIKREDGEALVVDLFDVVEVGRRPPRTTKYCPSDWEKLTEQQIDRFAAISIAQEILDLASDARLSNLLALLQEELERPAIELLEPAIAATRTAIADLSRPAIPTFTLQFPTAQLGRLKSDNGILYVRSSVIDAKRIEYAITGIEMELQLWVVGEKVTDIIKRDSGFANLAHATRNGTPVSIAIITQPGEEVGASELLAFLRPLVTTVEDPTYSPQFDIPRYWRRLLELEQSFFPEYEILREIGPSKGRVNLYAYERTGQDFDFDESATVEVRLSNGRRVGELNLDLTDERVLAIELDLNRHLSVGDVVTLVDRRARTSFDRRNKAIERILSDEAEIIDLMSYFDPGKQPELEDYGSEISEDVFARYRLNTGQRESFRQLAKYGPVGFLQGPPGTGKTHFIAAFAHWLITETGARKVLIASQSNEAVNNVIEKLLDLFKMAGGQRPSLLRIGSKGITERIRPYHTSSLRERYQSRFENAFKSRVATLATAAGINRQLAEDAVEIDRQFGRRVRRIKNLESAAKADSANSSGNRPRESAWRNAVKVFKSAGEQVLNRDVDERDPDGELDAAYLALVPRHRASPSDITKIRRIIELSHEWSDSLASPHRNFEEFLAKTRSIVTATCVGVGQTKIRIDAQTFDWVIVDEAARCTPGELAVPIQVGRRVLLVGDQRQLLPMIERNVLKGLQKEMPNVSASELIRSDFERAFLSPFGAKNGMRLTEQYRMAEPICQLVSKVFYEPYNVRLTTSADRKSTNLFSNVANLLRKHIVWVDTSSRPNHVEKSPDWNPHSFYNIAEVEAVMKILERIADEEELFGKLRMEHDASPIGVICMYSAQKVKIEQEFSRRPWDASFRRMVRIETVDSYQGKENTIVILTLVRCNDIKDQGHVGRPNRCNVALSRAKERVFIVGARVMWGKAPLKSPMRQVLAELEGSSSAEIIASEEL